MATTTDTNSWDRSRDRSNLEIFDIQTGRRQLLAHFDYLIEAPNWTRDGRALIYNSEGRMYRFDLDTHASQVIDTGFATHCNNDHVLSADGRFLAISHQDPGSRIYTLPLTGGTPRLITPLSPSYLHGWSPDGASFCYCAGRGQAAQNGDFDIFISDGQSEKQLTFSAGLSDGPEYSPDGAHIWFNSVRTGLMQIWRMRSDGSDQEQITFDEEFNSWFPHVSPNGRFVVFLSYHTGDTLPHEHLPHRHVVLRLLDITTGQIQTLCSVFGGQGTLNVNSWAPDSRYFAFVSYIVH